MNLNKVILQGRLTKDPEIRYTSTNNIPIARFTLAVDRYKKEEVDFINCVAWNKTAEFVNNYFNKGKMMLLEGRITTRNWEDTEGKKHYATEVTAEQVYFGESKGTTEQKEEYNNGTQFTDVEVDEDLPF